MGERRGIQILVLFFLFGFTMASLTVVLLLFPGTPLDSLWDLNPRARENFHTIGSWSLALMAIVALTCLTVAVGLTRLREWARLLAIATLTVNLIGDLTAALVRHELATLIGLPIGGAIIYYLMTPRVRRLFAHQSPATPF